MRGLLLIAALGLAACGNRTTQSAVENNTEVTAVDSHTAENSLDYQGTYTGTFPAADCPGIEVTLSLLADSTYTEHNSYLERDVEFDEKGHYRVEGNLLTLTPDKGSSVSYYKIGENHLSRLDADKQPVTGKLAEHYVLHKKIAE